MNAASILRIFLLSSVKPRAARLFRLCTLVSVFLLLAAPLARATDTVTYTVTYATDTTGSLDATGTGLKDSSDSTGLSGDLRWALTQANTQSGPVEIVFNPASSHWSCSSYPCTVLVTGPLPLITSTGGLTIDGGSYGKVAISGLNGRATTTTVSMVSTTTYSDVERLFFVQSGAVTLKNLILRHALALGGRGLGAGGGGLGAGACLFVYEPEDTTTSTSVTLDTVSFDNCSAQGGGTSSSGYCGGGGMGGDAQRGGNDSSYFSFGGGGGGILTGNTDIIGGTTSHYGGAGYGSSILTSYCEDGGFGQGGSGAEADQEADPQQVCEGGAGGFGGGGGGGGALTVAYGPIRAGDGGFGGGGGGESLYSTIAAKGGFGGGDGAIGSASGNGGSAYGPAVFVYRGTLTLRNTGVDASTITSTAGTGAVNGSADATPVYQYHGTVNGVTSTSYGPVAYAASGNTLYGAMCPTATAASYKITPATTALTAGTAAKITVAALNSSSASLAGSFVGLPSAFTLTSSNSDPGLDGGLSGTLSCGTATLSFTPETAATAVTLAATGTLAASSSTAITGKSASLTVKAGAAATLSVTGPSIAQPGTAAAVTLTPYDAYSNAATYTGTVKFTTTDSAASLSPASSTVSAAASVSTSVTFGTPGKQTVTATAGSLTGTSGSIGIGLRTAPALTAAFSPAAVASKGATTLTVTVTNPNTVALSGVVFSNTYPVGVTASKVQTTCPNTSLTSSTTGFSIAGVSLAASGSCAVTVALTAPATSGTLINTLKAATSIQSSTAKGSVNTATLTVKLTPTLAIGNLPTAAAYGGSFTPTYTYSGDGTTKSVVSSTTKICTVASGKVSFIGIGLCSLTPSVTAGTKYSAIAGAAQKFYVRRATPTITWATPAAITYGKALSSTQLNAKSSLAAGTFVYAPSTGSVLPAGSQTLVLIFTPKNTTDYVTVTKTNTLTVKKASQTITFASIAAQAKGKTLALTATASSGLAVTFTSTTTKICTVSGSKASFVAAGTCTLSAAQAGNANWSAATAVSRSFTVK